MQHLDKCAGVAFLCSTGLPEDVSPVPKHREFGTSHELYFIMCI
jgi:hypothetical protein